MAVKLTVRNTAPDHEDMDFDVHVGDVISVETTPGKGVKVTVKPDGTLHIAVDVAPEEARCLQVVPEEPSAS